MRMSPEIRLAKVVPSHCPQLQIQNLRHWKMEPKMQVSGPKPAVNVSWNQLNMIWHISALGGGPLGPSVLLAEAGPIDSLKSCPHSKNVRREEVQVAPQNGSSKKASRSPHLSKWGDVSGLAVQLNHLESLVYSEVSDLFP